MDRGLGALLDHAGIHAFCGHSVGRPKSPKTSAEYRSIGLLGGRCVSLRCLRNRCSAN